MTVTGRTSRPGGALNGGLDGAPDGALDGVLDDVNLHIELRDDGDSVNMMVLY